MKMTIRDLPSARVSDGNNVQEDLREGPFIVFWLFITGCRCCLNLITATFFIVSFRYSRRSGTFQSFRRGLTLGY